MAGVRDEKKSDVAFADLEGAFALAPLDIKKLYTDIQESFNKFKKFLDDKKSEKKKIEKKEEKIDESTLHYKNTREYQTLIWIVDQQYQSLYFDAEVKLKLIANNRQEREIVFDKPYLTLYADCINDLTDYMVDPTNARAGEKLLSSVNCLDNHYRAACRAFNADPANHGNPSYVILGKLLMIIGAVLAVAAILGIALVGLSGIGLGFAAQAVQGIGAMISIGGVSATSYVGLQSLLVGVLGASLVMAGDMLQYKNAPRSLPPPKHVQTLKDLYDRGTVVKLKP